ncbi:MAG: TonB-dependent receptor [Candidatus Latescibacteria bacterium]|nr:TonB-dependent receptor [Candidatus Latescibacterota bacterium]
MNRVLAIAIAILLGNLEGYAAPDQRCGQVVDAHTMEPLGGVWLKAQPALGGVRQVYSDTAGAFCFGGLPPGACPLEAERLGYEPFRGELDAEPGRVLIRLQPQPLVLEGMVVEARRHTDKPTSAFVERIPLGEQRPSSLPELLEQATGVQIRRQGGLGSFSTASIRGSTAEQVQVLVDGVPLNQAIGGGVDLGRLLVGGVERVEVYRGAVPARFGGNSLGGVVNLQTRAPAAHPRFCLQGMNGSFGTWQASGSVSGPWKGGHYLGLVEGTGSRNDFSFRDDNGTPYNLADDEQGRRRNSDFFGLRSLLKAERPWGRSRIRAHHTLDLRRQGIPGIGNYQAHEVRFDTWQDLSQVELSGPASKGTSYELSAYHSLQQDRYKDPKGEVGTGIQRHRNTTRGAGVQGALHLLWGPRGMVTLMGRGRGESFAPRDLLKPQTRWPSSHRYSGLLGGEGEVELGEDQVRLVLGGQVEFLRDQLVHTKDLSLLEEREKVKETAMVGGQAGGEWRLARGWNLQAHVGRYQRPPSFYELFGDRGAVIGNTDLRRERGLHWDTGLSYAPDRSGGLRLLELAFYHKSTRDLIRFVQNSQQISRPYNIGLALVRGLELRGEAGLGAWRLSGNYAYQQALNHSPFPFEKGKDLPNAPRQSLNFKAEVAFGTGQFYYDLNGESRQFLDRANLRPVSRRLFHTLGLTLHPGAGYEVSGEIRNLGGDQVEDLWGYPLPGRSLFLAVRKDFIRSDPAALNPKPQE